MVRERIPETKVRIMLTLIKCVIESHTSASDMCRC